MTELAEATTGNTIAQAAEEKKKQKIYWTEDTEAAVKEYLSLDFNHLSSKLGAYLKNQRAEGVYDPTIDDGYIEELKARIASSGTDGNQNQKEAIFRARIRVSLNRLIENIIFSFKLFRYDIDVKTLHNDCMSHVYEKFYKFDPDQNTKSFSYFGTIAKHYLQNRKKDLDILKSINLNYEDHAEEVDERQNYELKDGPEVPDEIIDLFNHMIVAFERNMSNKALNDNDRRVLDSILALFKSHGDDKAERADLMRAAIEEGADPMEVSEDMGNDVLDDNRYNKGNILDFILDRSKVTKDEMGKSLTKLRNLYKDEKKEFYEEGE